MLAGIQALFAATFSEYYRDATLELRAKSGTRDPATGSFEFAIEQSVDVKVQINDTNAAKREPRTGAVEDFRILVLWTDELDRPIGADDRIILDGETYRVQQPPRTDPAKAYWDCSCTKVKT